MKSTPVDWLVHEPRRINQVEMYSIVSPRVGVFDRSTLTGQDLFRHLLSPSSCKLVIAPSLA